MASLAYKENILVTCNLEVANCVNHELAFLCSLAACYGPRSTMPSIESFREWEHGPTTGTLNVYRSNERFVGFFGGVVLVQRHYNDACHFEENPTVSQAHLPASVFGCSNNFGCVKLFAVLFPDLSAPV